MPSDTLTSAMPTKVSQKLIELRKGNATSRAPICSGTATFMKPITKGIATKKIMMTPWAEKIWS